MTVLLYLNMNKFYLVILSNIETNSFSKFFHLSGIIQFKNHFLNQSTDIILFQSTFNSFVEFKKLAFQNENSFLLDFFAIETALLITLICQNV